MKTPRQTVSDFLASGVKRRDEYIRYNVPTKVLRGLVELESHDLEVLLDKELNRREKLKNGQK